MCTCNMHEQSRLPNALHKDRTSRILIKLLTYNLPCCRNTSPLHHQSCLTRDTAHKQRNTVIAVQNYSEKS